jgi:hypothetical protein
LRSAKIDPAKGALTDLKRIVAQIRKKWKRVHIVVRGDSGFCRDAIMRWCERQGIDYVFGLAKNARLLKQIQDELKEAEAESKRTGQMARIFKNLRYQTEDTWSRMRRVVARCRDTERNRCNRLDPNESRITHRTMRRPAWENARRLIIKDYWRLLCL